MRFPQNYRRFQRKNGERKVLIMSKHFQSYRTKLARESFVKALMFGLAIGFGAMALSALVLWFTYAKFYWLSIIVMAVTAGVVTPIVYYKKFQPTVRETAARIDELGLEERMITMTQLEGDESYIAKRQREDALNALNTVNASLLKFVVSVPLVIALSVTAVCGIGMTTVSALTAHEVIKGGDEIIDEFVTPEPKQFELLYEVGEGEGMIEGSAFQIVQEGGTAEWVMAVPDDEWVFVEWSDGSTDPYRMDTDIASDMTITAIFQQGEPGEGEKGDQGDEGEEGEGQPEGDSQEGDQNNGDSNEAEEGGGAYEDNNQVIDGETFYGGATYDNAYDDAMNEVTQDSEISKDEKDVIGNYFDTIAKS